MQIEMSIYFIQIGYFTGRFIDFWKNKKVWWNLITKVSVKNFFSDLIKKLFNTSRTNHFWFPSNTFFIPVFDTETIGYNIIYLWSTIMKEMDEEILPLTITKVILTVFILALGMRPLELTLLESDPKIDLSALWSWSQSFFANLVFRWDYEHRT